MPAAAVALAVGGAGTLLAGSAHATAAPSPAPGSQADLRQRIATALDNQAAPAPARTASAPKAGPRIIGGVETTITNAPWMAQLWYTTPDNKTYFCGGSVVSPTKIITAAHCVSGWDWFRGGVVVTGTDQLPTKNADGSVDLHGGTVSSAWRQWNHPSYNASTIDNDIAVLTLAAPVAVKPLKVTTAGDTASYQAGQQATVYGWGRTSSTSNAISQTLKTATLPVDSDATCGGFYGSQFIAGHMMCAGQPAGGTDATTTGTCNGDSGGPLVVRDDLGEDKLIGVVSWGTEDCAYQGSYSVFTKVSGYADTVAPRTADTDLSGAAGTGLFARTPDGTGYGYDAQGGTSLAPRKNLGDWSGLDLVREADLNADGRTDLVVRSVNGVLFWEHYVPETSSWAVTSLGGGWNVMKSIVIPGDLTGDGLPDLLAVDSSGVLWDYPGTGKGPFGNRIRLGAGWNVYGDALFGRGDYSGDGKADLFARDSSGVLWLYKGTASPSAGFAPRVRLGAGWNFTAYVPVPDVTGDGKRDLLVRESSGVMWLYPGSGSGTVPFGSRTRLGAGWNIYNLFG